jgi:formylglycine-generating enzyme required for sulfatase activity
VVGSIAASLPVATSSSPTAGTHQNLNQGGFERISPVTAFPSNGYSLHDMIGNMWEWTPWWSTQHEADTPKACAIPENPLSGREDEN